MQNVQNLAALKNGNFADATNTSYPENGMLDLLLERCRKGDQKATYALLKRYEGLIHGLAYKLAGNYDDAADVVSETYVRLCSMLGSCRSASALTSWIRRVVFNAFYDIRRRTQRNPSVSLDGMLEDSGDACLVNQENKTISPEQYVDTLEKKQIVQKAIASLPSHHQEMIQLFYLDEHTYEEISAMMGIAVGTVKSRLNRAREALQKKLMVHSVVLTN